MEIERLFDGTAVGGSLFISTQSQLSSKSIGADTFEMESLSKADMATNQSNCQSIKNGNPSEELLFEKKICFHALALECAMGLSSR